jgi:MFS family permease
MAGAPLEAVPVRAVAAFVLARWRSYLATIGGTCLKSLLSLAPSLWLPSLFVREFGWNIASAGIALGVVTIVFSPLSMVAGGRIAEAWARRGIEDANMRIVLHALWVAVPLGIVLPLLPGPWWVLAAYAVQTIATGLGFGPGIASFQLITPNAMRAQIGSLTQFGSNVLAFALSPLIVALMTDYLFRDPAYLKYSIALCGLIFGPVALWAVAQGMGAYRRDYAAAVRAGY